MAPSMLIQEQPLELESHSSELPDSLWESIAFPKGDEWPAFLKSPLAWEPNNFKDEDSFVYKLDEDEIKEITSALKEFKAQGRGKIHYSRAKKSNFILPTLGPKLELLSIEVHNGKGFFILRGLNPKEFTRQENIIIFLGISSYIASRVGRQSLTEEHGRMFSHITTPPLDHPPFHADVIPHILALYCMSVSETGGRSKIASSWKIYNEIARTRPDILVTLAADDWLHTAFYQKTPDFKRPLLHLTTDEKPILNFTTHDLTGSADHPRPADIPPLTTRQLGALKVVDQLANKYCLETGYLPGDMRFINNLAVLHARDAYHNEGDQTRHLVRLWLSSEEHGWKIPSGLKRAWEEVFESIEGVKKVWNDKPDANHMLSDSPAGSTGGTSCG